MNRIALTLLLALAALLPIGAPARAVTYEVGPAAAYTSLAAVPWTALLPGDIVQIDWRSTPYRESILISASGTAAAHIKIIGKLGPNGELPIIDGSCAVQSQNIALHAASILTNLGLVQIGPPKGVKYGYIPAYIDIDRLEICNATKICSYTDYTGLVRPWNGFCGGIYCECASHLCITRCRFHDDGLGIFVNSKNGTAGTSSDIELIGDSFDNCGVVGSAGAHDVYVEAVGSLYDHCRFGDQIAGASGNPLKDRSSGTVVRYCLFGSGGHCIDLVETMGGQGVIDQQPNYRQSYVYGNVIYNTNSSSIVHYGGDQYVYKYYRQGMLHFWNNTLVNTRNVWSVDLFQLPSHQETQGLAKETVDAQGNEFVGGPYASKAIPTELEFDGANTGTVNLAGNLTNGLVKPYHYVPIPVAADGGIVNGFTSSVTTAPAFTNAAALDFTRTAASPPYGAYRALAPPPGAPADSDPAAPLIVGPAGVTALSFEAPAPAVPPVVVTPPVVIPPPSPIMASYSVSGRVTLPAGGSAYFYTVNIGILVAYTAVDGTYTIKNVPPGTYTIRVTKGARPPAQGTVTVTAANVTGCNFVAGG